MHLIAAGLTDTGRVRDNNQDAFAIVPKTQLAGILEGLLVVADGMGGHRGGATASHLAVEAIENFFGSGRPLRLDGDAARLAAIGQALVLANQAINERSSVDPHLAGMGTTCTMAVAADSHLYFGHVGDSRAYLIRESRARQLTRDHSLVAEQVRQGIMTQEEADQDERRHVLLRAVGPRAEVQADTFSFEPRPGDLLLLCSDGLTNMLDDQQIARLASESADPGDACSRLIAAANARGGEDNITAVVGQVLGL